MTDSVVKFTVPPDMKSLAEKLIDKLNDSKEFDLLTKHTVLDKQKVKFAKKHLNKLMLVGQGT